MKARSLLLAIAALALALTALAPPALAQLELTEPLAERADGKADAAQEDPQTFAENQTSEEQLADDAKWGVAYGCYLADEGTALAGAEPPEVDQCRGYEEALGIAEEEQEQEAIEEEVAEAVPLEDDAAAQAEALAEDALDTVGEAVEDPGNALDTFLAFIGRTLETVDDLLDDILDGLDDALDILFDALGILFKGAGIALAAPFVGAWWLIENAWLGVSAALTATAGTLIDANDGLVSLVKDAIDGVKSGGSTAADGVTSAVGNAVDGVVAAADKVIETAKDVVDSIFGGGSAPGPSGDALPTDTADDAVDDAGSLLDKVTEAIPL